jgi:hypothetical protein
MREAYDAAIAELTESFGEASIEFDKPLVDECYVEHRSFLTLSFRILSLPVRINVHHAFHVANQEALAKPPYYNLLLPEKYSQ